jgi:hypothetical protein
MLTLDVDHQMEADVRLAYGDLMSPDYAWVMPAADQAPYQGVIQDLHGLGAVVADATDLNEDVSTRLQVQRGDDRLLLQLSLVGRYALVRLPASKSGMQPLTEPPDGASAFVSAVFQVLQQNGLVVLARDKVLLPLGMALFNTPPEEATYYQALFSDEPPGF